MMSSRRVTRVLRLLAALGRRQGDACRLVAFAVFLLFARSASAQTDIFCGCTGKRFSLPQDCRQSCAQPRACFQCQIAPQCSGLNVQKFKIFYNRALFGVSGGIVLPGMPASNPNDVLVAFTINYWYKPYTYTSFNVAWGSSENTGDWADVTPPSSPGQKPTLTISPEAVTEQSPAAFVNTIGHEMVHAEQLERKYSVYLASIDRVLKPFKELEASTWETGASNFKWKIGSSTWSTCMTEHERHDSQATLACRDWQVRKGIQDLVGMAGRSAANQQTLEKYLTQNPWTSQVWLKQHPDWKTITAGPQPAQCPNP